MVSSQYRHDGSGGPTGVMGIHQQQRQGHSPGTGCQNNLMRRYNSETDNPGRLEISNFSNEMILGNALLGQLLVWAKEKAGDSLKTVFLNGVMSSEEEIREMVLCN